MLYTSQIIDNLIMASRKPKQTATVAKSMKASTGGRVAKRSHKKLRFHANGLLNVEQKTGKYLKIARQNQRNSPLLRLPAEIRNLIFGYALGGRTFHISHNIYQDVTKNTNVSKNTSVSKNALALLAVCRQVFAETALLPFSSNTFSAIHPQVFNMWIEDFPSVFAEAVTSVRLHPCVVLSLSDQWLDLHDGIPDRQDLRLGHRDKRLSSNLTSLKNVQLVVGMVIRGSKQDSNKPQERGWQFIKGLYEAENSKVEFTRGWRLPMFY
ncbi:hypothetical protein J4E93_004687 [Alternaria ventricosa]|uniref:uncharacterized protein n=1 Tax=Alternaria ventricosa TaxID=1187951 RepID=UPI0020C25F1F|nr:uncharacterized protein J4E93_004687 [Alternaria ventricosa]KAI4648275.1 hypothetical protein J4E93_004687 [Alternaria ventricosa]